MILSDNSTRSSTPDNIEEFLKLQNIANRKISELLDDQGNNLFIYPHSFQKCDDGTDKQILFSLQTTWSGDTCKKAVLETGNIAGFIGVNGLSVAIHSRFSKDGEEDFFLHYMLEKVLGINMVNLSHGTNDEAVFDFLIYLFPQLLNEALSQGVYKEYRRNDYNDANVKGPIGINRHLKFNMPFNGRIAYSTREFSYDNHVTQLIRHTIEYIGRTKLGKTVLEKDAEMRSNVGRIVSATSQYNPREREKVIKSNLKIISHPYYSRYTDLQKLCLRILRHERIKYGVNEDKISGILFDVSYLWEEYLATILAEQGFVHPNNKKGTGSIYLAKQFLPNVCNRYPRYPDYYRETDKVIVDAKYKNGIDTRDDIKQMITYIYRLKGQKGIFILPTFKAPEYEICKLLGYGLENSAEIEIYQCHIPQAMSDYSSFRLAMADMEQAMATKFNCIITI
ncbi:MAG: hypothetical protein HDR88_01150 [Bacteroides sp.]|nr:hypothetical protein [Bacteroides sp.]